MTKPRVILTPHFRGIDEIFDEVSLHRLGEISEVVWGRDEPMPVDAFRSEIRSATAVVFGTWMYGDALAEAGDDLTAVLEVAGGHHHPALGYPLALERGLHVGSCAPAFARVVAEHALALTLASVRGICEADRAMRRGDEKWLHAGNESNSSLFGSKVGFVGFGGIARQLRRLLEPFDIAASAFDPHVDAATMSGHRTRKTDLETVFDQTEVICVAAAPTDDNRALVSRDLLERMRPDQTLVIISRAALVDFDAAVELASMGRFTLATDVFPEEPPPADAPVRSAARAILTPHLAGALPQALHAIGRMVVDDLSALFAGAQPTSMQYLTDDSVSALVRFSGP